MRKNIVFLAWVGKVMKLAQWCRMGSKAVLCCLITFMSCSQGIKSYKVTKSNSGDEKWKNAEMLSGFIFPWEKDIPESTTFSAVYDDSTLYCRFIVRDSTLVLADTIREELNIAMEDRVEIFFSKDREMKEYYCVEVDPLGRVLDYQASYHRHFDNSWKMEGIKTIGERTKNGYRVELMIPLKCLPFEKSGQIGSIHAGLYRADLRTDNKKKISEHWISWMNPKTEKPDFHVPESLGIFQFSR